MNRTQHDLSKAFPELDTTEFEELKRDIQANGQRSPVVIYQEQVLDGWNRHRALIELGLPVVERMLPDGEDPVAFVKSQNLHRRHLTATQRAAAIVGCDSYLGSAAADRCAPGAHLSKREIAQQAKTSERTVAQVRKGFAAGLAPALRAGTLSAKRAEDIANLPVEERAGAMVETDGARRKVVRLTARPIHDDRPATPGLRTEELTEPEIRAVGMGQSTTSVPEDSAVSPPMASASVIAILERAAMNMTRSFQDERRRRLALRRKHQQLRRGLIQCGAAIGERNLDKVASAVEAFVKKHGAAGP